MIEGSGLLFEPLRDVGVIDAYGVTVSDLLAIFLALFLLRDFINSILFNKKIVFYWYDRVVTVSFLFFFLFSYYSSGFLSFDFIFSFVHLLQYSKLLLSYFAVTFLFRANKNGKEILFFSFLGLLLFNILLSYGQFFSSFFSLGSSNTELFSYHLPEEESIFSRPNGVLLHSNQLGFMAIIWTLSLLLLKKIKENYRNILLVLVAILLVFTQSRTVWIMIVPLVIYYIVIFFRKKIFKISVLRWSKKNFYSFFLIVFLSLIIVQRLFSSQFSFDGGSAGIRIRMLKDGFAALSESYWFGFGPATNVKAIYELIPDSYIKDFPYPVHNGYLQMALESGLFATFFFFFSFLLFLFINLKNRQNWFSSYLIISVLVYYIFQPYAGRIEFPFLGMFLAFVCINYSHLIKND